MRTLTNAEFKRWQTLPLPARLLREGAGATRLSECRSAESAGPSCAKPERDECRLRQTGASPEPGNRRQDSSTIHMQPRP